MPSLGEIASAFVGIRPKIADGFEDDLNSQLNPGLRRVAGDAARIFAGVKLAGFFRDGIAELSEAERVLAQTRQTIRSTGGAANVTEQDFADLTSQLSELSGVDDELIGQGANLLLTFKNVRNEVGKNNDIFDRATEAALDLSKAGFGSMESASIQLGKALNDPVAGMTALARSGITFSQQQKETIKDLVATGDVLAAQKIILAEVESQVGGVARAYGDTLPGKMERGRNAIDEAKASLTAGMVPALELGADAAVALTKGIDSLPPVLQEIAGIGVAAGGGIIAFARPISDAVGLMRSLNVEGGRAVGTLRTIGRLGVVGAGIGLVATGLNALGEALNNIEDADITEIVGDLADLARTGRLGGEAARVLGGDLDVLAKAILDLDTNAKRTKDSGASVAAILAIPDDINAEEATQRIDELDQALADLAKRDPSLAKAALKELTALLATQGVEAGKLRPQLDAYDAVLKQLGTDAKVSAASTDEAAGATKRHARNLSDSASQADRAREAIDKLTDALAGYEDQVTGQLDANIDLEQTFDDLTLAVQEHGRSLNIENADGRDNLRLLGDLASGVIDVGRAYFEQTNDVEGTRRKVDELTERFKAHLRQLGFTKTEIAALVEQYGLVPERIDTLITANGGQALTEIQKVQTAFDKLDAAAHEEGFGSFRELLDKAGAPKGRQFGGPFHRGDDLVVAETRPEVVLFPRRTAFTAPSDGRVLSGLDTAALFGGGSGGPSRVFNISGVTVALPTPQANPIEFMMRDFEVLEMAVG